MNKVELDLSRILLGGVVSIYIHKEMEIGVNLKQIDQKNVSNPNTNLIHIKSDDGKTYINRTLHFGLPSEI